MVCVLFGGVSNRVTDRPTAYHSTEEWQVIDFLCRPNGDECVVKIQKFYYRKRMRIDGNNQIVHSLACNTP